MEIWKQDPMNRMGFIPVPNGEYSQYNLHFEMQQRVGRVWHRVSHAVYRWGNHPGRHGFFGLTHFVGGEETPEIFRRAHDEFIASMSHVAQNKDSSRDIIKWPLATYTYGKPVEIAKPIGDGNDYLYTQTKLFEKESPIVKSFRENVRRLLDDLNFKPTLKERVWSQTGSKC
jgi:hypothetical protein